MKIALVGNQNSGKTTLFNVLTGMNAKIGNWPGVTIEKKTGTVKNTNHEITDLPGIYSLSPYSIEEDVSRKFIFDEKPDVIINIVDSTSLERSLYLTTQLLELDCKVIVALNMADILEKKGLLINENRLEQILGTKVIKISALKETGIEELIQEIEKPSIGNRPYIFDAGMEQTIKLVETSLAHLVGHKRFMAVKLLENDERFEELKDIAQAWLSLAPEKYNTKVATYSLTHQNKLLGVNNSVEQLALFILMVDSDLDMLRIYEEESMMPETKRRIIEEFGYFSTDLLALERKFHNRFCPDKQISVWTNVKKD